MVSNRMFRRVSLAALSVCVIGIASVSLAQQRSQNLFRGIWSGTLTPDIIVGVPEGHLERLSEPFNFELRVFNRGRTEVYFLTRAGEWDFTGREFQLTEIGENGVILGRLTGSDDGSQNGFSFNLTKIDDETLLLDWTMLSTRAELRFDGLDETGFAGTDELKLTDD